MAATWIAFPSVFVFLGLIYLANGVLLYASAWDWGFTHWASYFYGKWGTAGSHGGLSGSRGRVFAHLQRNSAILMFGSAILNFTAAGQKSRAAHVACSYWNYILIAHYAVETYSRQMGGLGGSTLVWIAVVLILILYYEHRHEALLERHSPQRGERRAPRLLRARSNRTGGRRNRGGASGTASRRALSRRTSSVSSVAGDRRTAEGAGGGEDDEY